MKRNTSQIIASAIDLANLIIRGLYDEPSDTVEGQINWEAVYHLACQNNVAGLAWHSAGNSKGLPKGLINQWRQKAYLTEIRRIQYDAERELVLEALAEEGISAIPMKGAALAHLYPALDMREMGDNDILYGMVEEGEGGIWHVCGSNVSERIETIREALNKLIRVMDELGYTAHINEPMSNCHDYKFTKPPFLVFEMHHAISNKWMDVGWAPQNPISNPWIGAKPADELAALGKGLALRREEEAEYAYFVFHALKHLVYGGIGIRVLADMHVMLNAWGRTMDWNRVKGYLNSYNALDFEADLRGLCNRSFAKTLEPGDHQWIARMVGERVYGLPVNKSYANHVRSFAARLGLKGPEQLPGHPMTYIGMGEVSRPLMTLFSAAWEGVQAVRAFRSSRV